MPVREEIERYSLEENKPILHWLFDRYHMQSEWSFVAFCRFQGKYPNSHRIWEPTYAGAVLYKWEHRKKEVPHDPSLPSTGQYGGENPPYSTTVSR